MPVSNPKKKDHAEAVIHVGTMTKKQALAIRSLTVAARATIITSFQNPLVSKNVHNLADKKVRFNKNCNLSKCTMVDLHLHICLIPACVV